MSPSHRLLCGAVFALPVALLSTASFGMTTFDGIWAVNISSTTNACKVRRVVPIQVLDGQISYGGPFDATADGKVAENGKLTVRLAHDGDVVSATGSLAGLSGSGEWSGPNAGCAGSWHARKS